MRISAEGSVSAAGWRLALAFRLGYLLLIPLPACRNLELPPPPTAVPNNATVTVWVLRDDPGTSVSVVARADHGQEESRAETQVPFQLPGEQQVDLTLPSAAGRSLARGTWTFTITISTQGMSGRDYTMPCGPVMLRDGEQIVIRLTEGAPDCSPSVGGSFSGHDLAVELVDVQPRPALVGSPLQVRVVLGNRGAHDEPSFNGRVTATSFTLGMPLDLGPLSGSLSKGEAKLLTINWSSPPLPGTYEITALVDAVVGEQRRDNNRLSRNITLVAPDADGDGVPDAQDKCPNASDRPDTDGDTFGDACDTCPYHPNPTQTDASVCKTLRIFFWPSTGACTSASAACNCDVPNVNALGQCIQLFGEGFDAGQTRVAVGGVTRQPGEVTFCDDGARLVFPGPIGGNEAVVVSLPGTAMAPQPNYCAATPPCPQPGPLAFTPISGGPGTPVFVVACGLVSGTQYRVQIGSSAPVPAALVHNQILRFAVPPGARSGRIRVLLPTGAPLGSEPARFFKVGQ